MRHVHRIYAIHVLVVAQLAEELSGVDVGGPGEREDDNLKPLPNAGHC